MRKFGLLTLVLALFASVGVSQLLKHFWPITNTEQLSTQVFFLLSGFILLILYPKRSTKPDFPAFLLGALIVRLLCCLVYILISAFVFHEHYRAVAFHFLAAFLFYTVADLLTSARALKKK